MAMDNDLCLECDDLVLVCKNCLVDTLEEGQMGILAHHMPLASGVEIAEMNYRIDKDKYEFAVGGGFVYVDGDNTVTLIVNDIESPGEIDLRRAEEAKARAEERLKSKNPEVDLQRAEIALKKAITRIHVKNNY